MTDDEINRRVAEIEGWYSISKTTWMERAGRGVTKKGPPPYTTDWTWCGPLLKRDIIRLEWDTGKPSRRWMALAKRGVLVIGNKTPQIAICRAVIAAHEHAILYNHEPPTPGPDRAPGRPHLAD